MTEEADPEPMFPILLSSRQRRDHPGWPTEIPWRLIAPHERQAQLNHGQSLRRLAERGGLDPREARKVIEGKEWSSYEIRPDGAAEMEAVEFLLDLMGR